MQIVDLFEDEALDRSRQDFWRDLQPHFGNRTGQTLPVPHWPLTPSELHALQGKILQNPDWLARYAYFGWRSWQEPEAWEFDAKRMVFEFSYVPHVGYVPREGGIHPDREHLYLDLTGKIVHPRGRDQFADFIVPLPAAVEACKGVVRDRAAGVRENLPYLSGRFYVRFGDWPENERSTNWLLSREDGEPVYEKGVSAYHAHFDVRAGRWEIEVTVGDEFVSGTMSSLFYSDRPVYLVQGTEIDEEGYDGEPLLHNVRKVKQLKKGEVGVAGVFDDEDRD